MTRAKDAQQDILRVGYAALGGPVIDV